MSILFPMYVSPNETIQGKMVIEMVSMCNLTPLVNQLASMRKISNQVFLGDLVKVTNSSIHLLCKNWIKFSLIKNLFPQFFIPCPHLIPNFSSIMEPRPITFHLFGNLTKKFKYFTWFECWWNFHFKKWNPTSPKNTFTSNKCSLTIPPHAKWLCCPSVVIL